MNTHEELLAALDAWKNAMISKDAAALDAVLHPDLAYSHSDAKHENKTDVIDKASRPGGAQKIEFSNVVVRDYGNAGFVKADVDYTNRKDDVDAIAYLNVLHVFVKDNGNWRVVARQAVRRPH